MHRDVYHGTEFTCKDGLHAERIIRLADALCPASPADVPLSKVYPHALRAAIIANNTVWEATNAIPGKPKKKPCASSSTSPTP